MPRVKSKSFGWAANRNLPRHQLKFVVTITQQFVQKIIIIIIIIIINSWFRV